MSIPHDPRAALLRTPLAEEYATREDDDQLVLTNAEAKLATFPLA